MKSRFLKIVLAAALTVVSGVTAYQAQDKEVMSDLALANVEALANEEIGNGRWVVTVYSPTSWRCDPNGGASCPGTPW